MTKSLTILLGTILACMLLVQIAANAASEMIYWETYDPSSGRLLWAGVVAAGLLLGGSVLMLHKPRIAAGAYFVSLPLLILYETEHNRNFLSISLDKSIATWLGFGIVLLVILAATTDYLERQGPE